MKRKVIIGLLIGQYEKAINACIALKSNDIRNYQNPIIPIDGIITAYSVEKGVCFCAKREFGQNINDRYWILRNCTRGEYWILQPR